MQCLRCGKTTQENAVFCDSCLSAMEKHPVKPGTAIHLPYRTAAASVKKQAARRKALPLEEQIQHLKRANRRLLLALLIALAALGLCAGVLVYRLTQPSSAQLPFPGRNYAIETDQYTN